MFITQRRLAAISLFLLLFAVLPQVGYLGHWGSHALSHTHGSDDHVAHHKAHCHAEVASCSDQPIPAGPGWLLLSDELLVMPAEQPPLAAPENALHLTETFISPLERPPTV